MSTSAKLSQTTRQSEALNTAVNRRTVVQQRESASENAWADLAENPIYKIMNDEKLKAETRPQAIATVLTYAEDKEKARAGIKAMDRYKEFLQDAREKMMIRVIELTNTDTFSRLQSVYDHMNGGLNDFENKLKPLMDLLDGVHSLRMEGKTYSTYQEIKSDQVWEEQNQAEIDQVVAEIAQIIEAIERLTLEIAGHEGETNHWIFGGGLKESARVAIKSKTAEIEQFREKQKLAQEKLDKLRNERQERVKQGSEAKAALRKLLDLTRDEHKDQVKDLVGTALNFVKMAKSESNAISDDLSLMGDQWEKLYDANGKITFQYAQLSEGLSLAERANIEKRKEYEPPVLPEGEEEGNTAKFIREGHKNTVDQLVGAISASKTDTATTFADLTAGAIRLKGMMDANNAQIVRVHAMKSQGVAGLAERLATSVTAVSQAATTEAAAGMNDALNNMREMTGKVTRNQAIANALGQQEGNNDLLRALDDLGASGDALREATSIQENAVNEARGYLDQLNELAKEVKGDISDAFAVYSESAAGSSSKEAKPRAAAPTDSLFKL